VPTSLFIIKCILFNILINLLLPFPFYLLKYYKVQDESVDPSSASSSASKGGEILSTEATTFGRTMTSISTFETNYNPLQQSMSTSTGGTTGHILIMTGGSSFGTEAWKDIDDKGKLLPTLSGSTNIMCSSNGINWEEVDMDSGEAPWGGRAGHWSGWWNGKLILIGGTGGEKVDYNDIWVLEPVGVVVYSIVIVALIAAGGK
jgi:hypothetical protein